MTYETQKRPLKCELEQRLKEATALLERCCPLTPPGSELRALTKTFVFGVEDHCGDPLCDFDECGSRASALPAAPEPSGELERLRAWVAKVEAMTTDLDPPDMLVHWVEDRERLLAAEAQLAAVRKLLAWTIMYVPTPWPMPREIGLAVQREIKGVVINGDDLLTAPSPGAGKETER